MMSWGALFFSDTTMGGEPIAVSIATHMRVAMRAATRERHWRHHPWRGRVPGTRAWHR